VIIIIRIIIANFIGKRSTVYMACNLSSYLIYMLKPRNFFYFQETQSMEEAEAAVAPPSINGRLLHRHNKDGTITKLSEHTDHRDDNHLHAGR